MKNFEKDKLYFLPLGGAGHFGCNLNLYIYNDQILVIDLGIGFPEAHHPGLDVIFPDIDFLRKNKEKIVGMVITHAHEDHIGGVSYLWDQIGCPVYATPFTASILKSKLKETKFGNQVPLHVLPTSARFSISDFDCEFVHLTHSVPEQSGMLIRLPSYKKTVFHTGDWCLDDTPVVGQTSDLDKLKKVAKEGILLAVSDSTNAMKKTPPRSELDVQKTLDDIFGTVPNRLVVTCFASNIARLQSILTAAEKNDRHVVMLGRSMWRMYEAAIEVGHIKPFKKFVEPEDAGYLPKNKILVLCTGTQGETRSALAKLAFDDHKEMALETGDTVLFSSWVIPGNEKNVVAVKSQFIKKGVKIIDDLSLGIHSSGHPHHDELEEMYNILNPDIVIPVHGEIHMMHENARIAESCGARETYCPTNGDVLEINETKPFVRRIDKIDIKPMALDGLFIVEEDSPHINNRKKLTFAGCATATVVVDWRSQLIVPPVVTSWGLIDGFENEKEIYEDVVLEIENNIVNSKDDAVLKESVYFATRRFFNKLIGKKPMTHVHLIRIKEKI